MADKDKTASVAGKKAATSKDSVPRRVASKGSGTPKGRRFRSLGAAAASAGT